MQIRLTIDNVDRLPNAGPLSFRSDGRSFEIGREGGDWILPDPDLFISGRHCEVRFEQGDFWLFDHSRNGTFVNGTSQRIASPYRLANGDRLRIGRYELQVEIDGRRGGVADIRAGPATMARSAANIYPPAVGPRADGFLTERENEALRPERDGIAVRPVPREGVAFSSEPFTPAASSPGMSFTGRSADRQVRGEEPSGTSILRAIALGAGVSPEVFEQRDPHEVATEIGAVLRIAVDELAQLLKARAAAKALVKSHDRTMIGPADNNPIKFVPGSEDVLDIMFARRRGGYLDARRSFEESFRDLKAHEFATFAAMQQALSRLLDDLSPEAIEEKLAPASFGSRKRRAWDAFVANWEAKADAHENGMLDIFLAYFSDAYGKAVKPK